MSTHGLPDLAWLGKPHCEYCGEKLPQEILDAVEREVAIQAAIETLAAASIAALNVALGLAEAVKGMSDNDLDEVYGENVATLLRQARAIAEPFKD